jgi:flagellar biogenesis protein FliO
MTTVKHVVTLALLVMSLTSHTANARAKVPSPSKDWLRAESQHQAGASAISSRSGIGKSLAVVLLLGVGGYAVWRRKRPVKINALPNKTHIRVVSGTLVGPKARAVVAEVGGRLILLGVTEQSVRKLAWLESVADNDAERESGQEMGSNAPGVSDARLAKISSSVRSTSAPSRHEPQRSKFSEVLRDAVGIKPHRTTEPALVLADSTHDRINLTSNKDPQRNGSPLIDIEGQAAGLVSRLGRLKQ